MGLSEWTESPILAVVEPESSRQKLSVRASDDRSYRPRSLVRTANVVRISIYAVRA